MLRQQLIDICPILFVGLTVVYIILKLIVLKRSKVKKSNYNKAFTRALLPVSKQERKNMTNTRLANFYARSNDINFFYYLFSILVIGGYFLMSAMH